MVALVALFLILKCLKAKINVEPFLAFAIESTKLNGQKLKRMDKSAEIFEMNLPEQKM
jgi:hypothetical protein